MDLGLYGLHRGGNIRPETLARPVQRPHPPILTGGHSPAALARAARTANGWYGVYLDVAEAEAAIHRLRGALSRADRPAELGELHITITPPGPVSLAEARGYADLGVDRLVIIPAEGEDDVIEPLIEEAGETLVGRV